MIKILDKITFVFAFVVLLFFSRAAFCETQQSLLSGLEYRKNIIQTAVYEYSFFKYDADNANLPQLDEKNKWNRASLVSAYTLTIAGNNWAEIDVDNVVRHLRDNKYKYTFLDKTVNDDGTIQHALEIQPADYTFEEYIKLHPDFRVVQGGVVPWESLLSYFLQHPNDTKHESEISIENDTSGEKYELLEWIIPKSDYKVLFAASTLIADSPFMRVRVYISPNKGYAIRRLEYLTADRKFWGHRFESTEFIEADSGIWIPMNYRIIFDQHTGKGDGKLIVWEYLIKKVANINEPIPNEKFDIRIPKGTTVYDETGRSGTQLTFSAGDDISLTNIDAAVQNAIKIKKTKNKRSIVTTTNYDLIFRILLFCTGCCFLCFAIWLHSGEKKNSSKSDEI
ncbi:MAG: hypothetical protein LBQ66_00115 [Planctomycetaceae bacterium]|jgi:hypothetical protein|nr:hypothetical protein [Planctomycetaceae bacterium]